MELEKVILNEVTQTQKEKPLDVLCLSFGDHYQFSCLNENTPPTPDSEALLKAWHC